MTETQTPNTTRDELADSQERELERRYPGVARRASFYRRTKGIDIRVIALGENTCRVAEKPKSSLNILVDDEAVVTVHGPSECERTMRAIVNVMSR